jgi:hypothetical protein
MVTKTDRFGYQMDDTTHVDWIEATGGTKLVFNTYDDGFIGPVDIGFPFKFYENTYSQLYISTNGLVSFGAGSNSPANQPVPWDSLPNNFIAPFWDDLVVSADVLVPDRGVYTKLIGVPGSRKLVIEWHKVVRNTKIMQLTFELILYENGNVDFLYNQLDGELDQCTVGIEDGDGQNGLQYVYYEPGLSVGKEIRFLRPPAGRRIKALPRMMSNFAINHQTKFNFVLKNIGELGIDTYNLQVAPGAPGWTARISKSGGQLLSDTSADGVIDTGPLAAGQAITLSLELNTPPHPVIGDHTTAIFTATSTLQSSVWLTATAQAAVPGAFVQLYFDASGVQFRQVWDENVVNQSLGVYTGQALAVGNISNDKYLVAWERRVEGIAATEVVYQVVSRLGGGLQNPLVLTNSTELYQPPISTSSAQSPVIAKSSNGQVGVAWRQYLFKDGAGWNSNIYLTVLNSNGVRVSNRFDLINDTTYYTGTLDTHENFTPFLTAGINSQNQSRFFVCWIDLYREAGKDGRNLDCGVFSFTGSQLAVDTKFSLDNVIGATAINEPFLTNLGTDRVMIAYIRSTGLNSEIVYAVRNLDGTLVKSPTVVAGAFGDNVRAIQFPNNNVLILWRNYAGELQYIILDGTNYEPLPGGADPKTLPLVGNRTVAMPSATLDQSGNAQLTWVDAEDNNYLYYLVLAPDGSVVTPGMQFVFPILGTSTYGQGITSYLGVHLNFLPLLRK